MVNFLRNNEFSWFEDMIVPDDLQVVRDAKLELTLGLMHLEYRLLVILFPRLLFD